MAAGLRAAGRMMVLAGLGACAHLPARQHESRADDAKQEHAIQRDVVKLVRHIREHYPDESRTDYESLTVAALNGMLTSLDTYSKLLPRAGRAAVMDAEQGEAGDIGVELARAGWTIFIFDLSRGGPAEEAGLRVGDVLVSVDGQPSGKDCETLMNRLRGKPGSEVALKISRDRAQGREKFEVTLRRRVMEIASVQAGYLSQDGIGTIVISEFNGKTGKQLDEELSGLEAQGMKALVLDVRGCPGGSLAALVEVAGCFLPEGTPVVRVKGVGADPRFGLRSVEGGGRVHTLPVAVLTDGHTASAAECFAGALRQQGRAVLVGERTQGKGSVQRVDRWGEWGVQMTVAFYHLPDGSPVQGAGVKPDIEVAVSEEEAARMRQWEQRRCEALPRGEEWTEPPPPDRAWERAMEFLRKARMCGK